MGLEREIITKDDTFSEDPERRRSYWLQSAGSELDKFLGSVSRDLTVFQQNSSARLQTGECGRNMFYLSVISKAVPVSYRQQACEFISGIQAIAYEKGFRFSPALLTSREHKAIGSTG